MTAEVRDVPRTQFETARVLADHHLGTLSTEECLWRPANSGLHVHPGRDGHWRTDWRTRPATSILPHREWLTSHLGSWWSMVPDHSFGGDRERR